MHLSEPAHQCVDISIVTSGHDVADARVHRVTAALQRAGLRVELLGLGEAADGPPGAIVITARRGSLSGRMLTALGFARQARGAVLLGLDPDSLLACLAVGRIRRRAVAADVHEDYAALLRDRDWAHGWRGFVGTVVAGAATRAALAADLVIVADDQVPPQTKGRVVLRNLPDLSMLPQPRPRHAHPRALYVGDVRASRGLWSMVDAIANAPGWQLDIVGPVAPSDQVRLVRELDVRGLGSRVHLHGRLPPREAWQHARDAWCGLLLLEDTPAFREAVPSKLYEYLACGLAVIATDLPRQGRIAADSGAAEIVQAGAEAGVAAAAVLRSWSARPATIDVRRANALDWRARSLAGDPYADVAARLSQLRRRAGRPVQSEG